MMYYYCPPTPIINPIGWAEIAPDNSGPFERRTAHHHAPSENTEFATEEARPVDLFAAVTGTLAHTISPIVEETKSSEPTPTITESVSSTTKTVSLSQKHTDIDQIAKQRVKLMAAKYAGSAQSSEIVARLEILNRRLSERAPRVSKEQVSALEDAYDQLACIRASREERAKRLGIKG